MRGGKPKLTDVEQKGFEVGMKLAHYRAIRDKETLGMVPLLVDAPPGQRGHARTTPPRPTRRPASRAQRSLGAAGARVGRHPLQVPQRHPRQGPGDARDRPELRRPIHRLAQGEVGLGPARRDPRGPRRGAGRRPASRPPRSRRSAPPSRRWRTRSWPTPAGRRGAGPGPDRGGPRPGPLGQRRELSRRPAAMAREVHFNEFAPFFKAPMAYWRRRSCS